MSKILHLRKEVQKISASIASYQASSFFRFFKFWKEIPKSCTKASHTFGVCNMGFTINFPWIR